MNLGFRIGRALAALGLISTILFSAGASAVEVSGIKFDDTAKVNGQDLKLNGAGVRYKVFFKVYAAGLYLAEKKTTLNDILAVPGAKRVQLVMMRDVDADSFGNAFMEGIRKNSDMNERSKIINQMLTFGHLFGSVPELKKGDVLTTDWIPGQGTVCQLNGKKITDVIPDVAFYNALLKIWLGANPADSKLKTAMMGSEG